MPIKIKYLFLINNLILLFKTDKKIKLWKTTNTPNVNGPSITAIGVNIKKNL